MSARGRARRRALEILFEAEQRGTTPDEGITSRRTSTEQVINPYTVEIIHGVIAEQERIDEILSSYAQGWTLDRMPAVDRSILRIGAWELLFNDDVPDGVAVAESVTMAKELSTDASPEFVNGLLGRIQQLKPTLLD
ncbi:MULTISPECIES: transcription antitermination factor NusB [Micrococcaceae]|uniref:transcription antitermination factor NusB n=1 Tax=Micrococcaceae TaxID=1268 RepID=UPI000255F61B|nr:MULTISPECIES: transcription antitermination factor NusB [unclassified Citricoccus]MBB5749087.1 N utilization substance protein B [Micrococcus sp. TA1]MCY1156999.1 nusB [Citricoccus sp. WCRC_4]HRO30170.1 transcription antitermination factor NusB [Citricoccus sp.]HRO94188.1 transcription antitermination factor NusB [Citricoccus sp.]